MPAPNHKLDDDAILGILIVVLIAAFVMLHFGGLQFVR